jgi:hypothetical protein
MLRWPFLLISVVFVYTTVANIVERPEGIKIASFFIAATIIVSLASRALRATELRITEVRLDDAAREMIAADHDQIIRIVAHRPENTSLEEYDRKDAEIRAAHNIDPDEQLFYLEIARADVSDFTSLLEVKGLRVGKYEVLRASSTAIPNAIAALLIHIRDVTDVLPHAYFGWTEGNPVAYFFRFLFLGEGDVAPIAREVLRQNIQDPRQRPFIHVT